ncbi:uncharacterized protein EV154DRAFT_547247 [Mucor mucedo]|uniref:uncharacterized protein n=1 Tax=Mucor mucedo TaxID=29922 RepID=UPI00221E749D|nr:uncharacterized protein EV154DRAFT_547247 [Mucor mucedo]KAI7896595.1 hypothetical protein EV154DRAFT_547247 [Mucor mucedo]
MNFTLLPRVQFRQAQTLDLEEVRLHARTRNQRARLSAKLRRRKVNFLANEEAIVTRFHPKESCMVFLEAAYMSEDEDNVTNEHGQAISYTTLRPSWRTDELNNMLSELDSLHGHRNPGRHLPRTTVGTLIFHLLPRKLCLNRHPTLKNPDKMNLTPQVTAEKRCKKVHINLLDAIFMYDARNLDNIHVV